LVNITDPRHVRVYGGQGLYQATLDKLGLSNAWQGETNYWGFATSSIEQLNVKPGASLFYFQPVPEQTLATLNQSPLWRARDFVREQRGAQLRAGVGIRCSARSRAPGRAIEPSFNR
jgi:ABC-type Fe3+-hydroxamate transport system substrate-binding protein